MDLLVWNILQKAGIWKVDLTYDQELFQMKNVGILLFFITLHPSLQGFSYTGSTLT